VVSAHAVDGSVDEAADLLKFYNMTKDEFKAKWNIESDNSEYLDKMATLHGNISTILKSMRDDAVRRENDEEAERKRKAADEELNRIANMSLLAGSSDTKISGAPAAVHDCSSDFLSLMKAKVGKLCQSAKTTIKEARTNPETADIMANIVRATFDEDNEKAEALLKALSTALQNVYFLSD
jgi:hypothetical protein